MPESPSNATGRERPDTAQDRDEVSEAVVAFVFAESWDERKRVVEEHRDALLTDTADEVLSTLIAQRHRDGDGDVRDLEVHRRLLARCRREGIDAAFAEHSQKKQPFLESAVGWLIAFVIVILILVVLGQLFG